MAHRPHLLILCMLTLLMGMASWMQGYAAVPVDAQPVHCAQHDGAAPAAPAGGDCCQHDVSGCGCVHAAMFTQLPSWRMATSAVLNPATSPPGVEPVARVSSPFRPPI
jgi:hypothetical protein